MHAYICSCSSFLKCVVLLIYRHVMEAPIVTNTKLNNSKTLFGSATHTELKDHKDCLVDNRKHQLTYQNRVSLQNFTNRNKEWQNAIFLAMYYYYYSYSYSGSLKNDDLKEIMKSWCIPEHEQLREMYVKHLANYFEVCKLYKAIH
jgi:hypothetical protein